MGIVVFQWGEDGKLILLNNRDNFETRRIKAAAWDEDEYILEGRCELNEGTWFCVSKGGRVASLVDSSLEVNMVKERNPELIPSEFLESKLSPQMFANRLERDEKQRHMEYSEEDGDKIGRSYNLIVADITSNSMVYIRKPLAGKSDVITEQVAFGVHTLSIEGLDSESPKDLHLKRLFSEIIGHYENQELPPMNELAKRFMYDPTETVPGDPLTAIFVESLGNLPNSVYFFERYGTTSTTAIAVKPNKEVMFYEWYLLGDEWRDHNFTFNIDID